jgi:uncharacterized protein YaiI (UPF0178 family)
LLQLAVSENHLITVAVQAYLVQIVGTSILNCGHKTDVILMFDIALAKLTTDKTESI